MTNDEINQAVCKARGESPAVTYRMMNEAETGYSIEFDTLREIERWQSSHPGMCRGEHIVKWEKWSKYSESIEKAWELVEETKHGYIWDIYQMWSGGEASSWSAEIQQLTSGGLKTIADIRCVDTAPRAICMCWLTWKGAK